MNWSELLNRINEKGTAALDTVIEAGQSLGNKDKLKRGIRKAGEQIVDYFEEVPNKGLIPIPAPTPEIRTGLGYLKSLAGERGRVFRIGDNQESSKFYQDTVNAATKTDDGRVIFNADIADKEEYDRLGKSISNKDIGRYSGIINDQGEVIVEDDYDTNRPASWHLRRVLTGENAEGDPRPVDTSGRLISAASALHKLRQDAGKTNPRPFGHTVKMGTVNLDPQEL